MSGFEDFLGAWNITVIGSEHFRTPTDDSMVAQLGMRTVIRQRLGYVEGVTDTGVVIRLTDLDPLAGASGTVYREEPPFHGAIDLSKNYDGRGSLSGGVMARKFRGQDTTVLYVDFEKSGIDTGQIDFSLINPSNLNGI